jgi:hypothetical protein
MISNVRLWYLPSRNAIIILNLTKDLGRKLTPAWQENSTYKLTAAR